MKLVLAMVTMTLTAAFASTSSAGIVCKKSSEATSQGFEAVIQDKTATVSFKGKKVADLFLDQAQKAAGGDQMSVSKYSQHTVNGFGLTVSSGGVTGMTFATVLHDGVAGFTPLANLNDCKN